MEPSRMRMTVMKESRRAIFTPLVMAETIPKNNNCCCLAAIRSALQLVASTRSELSRRLEKLARFTPNTSSVDDKCRRPEDAAPALERLYANRDTRKNHVAAVAAAFRHCPTLACQFPEAHGQWLAALARMQGQSASTSTFQCPRSDKLPRPGVIAWFSPGKSSENTRSIY